MLVTLVRTQEEINISNISNFSILSSRENEKSEHIKLNPTGSGSAQGNKLRSTQGAPRKRTTKHHDKCIERLERNRRPNEKTVGVIDQFRSRSSIQRLKTSARRV